jgi:hypothetical protein
VEQFTQVLSGDLRDTIDIPGYGDDVLGDPRGRRVNRRDQCAPERARRAGEHERADTGRSRFLEQIEGSRDVGVDEGLP